jgi:hypothetical protein
MKIEEQYVHLIEGAWMLPKDGLGCPEFTNYVKNLCKQGIIDQDPEEYELEHPIPVFLAFFVHKGYITKKTFNDIINGQEVKTGCLNFKDFYADLIAAGVKINEKNKTKH